MSGAPTGPDEPPLGPLPARNVPRGAADRARTATFAERIPRSMIEVIEDAHWSYPRVVRQLSVICAERKSPAVARDLTRRTAHHEIGIPLAAFRTARF